MSSLHFHKSKDLDGTPNALFTIYGVLFLLKQEIHI